MKNEEAITCIKMMFAFWANAHELNVAQMEAAKDLAIAALGNGGFIETSKMVPLTLEQLRGMDGKPVRVHNLRPAKKKFEWQIALVCKFRETAEHSFYTYRFYNYGKTWLAYAYPPAHIDQEAWTAEWKEYTGADAGFHYCSKCGQQAFNYEDGGEVVEVLSDFCPSCGRPTTPEGLAELEKRLRGGEDVSNSSYCPKSCEYLVRGFGGKGFCHKYQAEIFMKYWPKAYEPPFRKCKQCRAQNAVNGVR